MRADAVRNAVEGDIPTVPSTTQRIGYCIHTMAYMLSAYTDEIFKNWEWDQAGIILKRERASNPRCTEDIVLPSN